MVHARSVAGAPAPCGRGTAPLSPPAVPEATLNSRSPQPEAGKGASPRDAEWRPRCVGPASARAVQLGLACHMHAEPRGGGRMQLERLLIKYAGCLRLVYAPPLLQQRRRNQLTPPACPRAAQRQSWTHKDVSRVLCRAPRASAGAESPRGGRRGAGHPPRRQAAKRAGHRACNPPEHQLATSALRLSPVQRGWSGEPCKRRAAARRACSAGRAAAQRSCSSSHGAPLAAVSRHGKAGRRTWPPHAAAFFPCRGRRGARWDSGSHQPPTVIDAPLLPGLQPAWCCGTPVAAAQPVFGQLRTAAPSPRARGVHRSAGASVAGGAGCRTGGWRGAAAAAGQVR